MLQNKSRLDVPSCKRQNKAAIAFPVIPFQMSGLSNPFANSSGQQEEDKGDDFLAFSSSTPQSGTPGVCVLNANPFIHFRLTEISP